MSSHWRLVGWWTATVASAVFLLIGMLRAAVGADTAWPLVRDTDLFPYLQFSWTLLVSIWSWNLYVSVRGLRKARKERAVG